MATSVYPPPTTNAVRKPAKQARVEKLIAWLKEHEAKLNAYEKVQITFNCAGDMISGDLKQMFHIARE